MQQSFGINFVTRNTLTKVISLLSMGTEKTRQQLDKNCFP
jgi:hypothetical protein